jgi:hypothetical protein
VRRALGALFAGAVGKDTVSRVWRKVKSDWDAWNARSLTEEPIVRLILDGTVVRVRLDRKATAISLLVVIGVRADGQKVLLAVKAMGGERTEAWRAVLDDLIKRGLRRPQFLIMDGAAGLEKAIAAVWDGIPVQRCTVHKHRNLLAHAPERLHDEVTADYTDMIYAATSADIEDRRKAFIRKWRLRHRPVADSLEEAGDRLFTFTRLPPSQWRSARTHRIPTQIATAPRDVPERLSSAAPVFDGVLRLVANHHDLAIFESTPEVRALCSAGIARPQRSYDPVRLPPWSPPVATLRPLPSPLTGLPRLLEPPFRRAVPTTPADRAGARVDCFPARAAFPKWQEGRHPHCHFRGLLKLHSRYGPPDCSAA